MNKITSEGDVNTSSNRKNWQDKNINYETNCILRDDEDIFLHQSLSTPCLNVLKKSKGIYLEDISEKIYMDFHGNNVHQVGFGNEDVKNAIINEMEILPFSPRRYTNNSAIILAQKLSDKTNGVLNKVLFSPGATSSIGIAMKLARLVTKKDGFLSFWDSFHGASIDAISLGGTAHFRNGIGSLLTGCEHLIPYNSYRPIFDEDTFLTILDYTLEKHGDIAAFFMETIRNTEVEIPSYKLMKGIRDICTKHNTLLVLDETAIAMGRTGKFFAFEHYDIVPDIVVIGKGLGGGIFPISALLTKDKFNIGQYTSLGHYTHEKSSVGCAAANAAIDFIDNNNILEKTSNMEKFVLDRLNILKNKYEIIGDVRAIGLLFAIELVKDRKTKEKAESEADKILYNCLDLGLSFKVSSGILTLSPPLIIEKHELEKALEILEESIKIENIKLFGGNNNE